MVELGSVLACQQRQSRKTVMARYIFKLQEIKFLRS